MLVQGNKSQTVFCWAYFYDTKREAMFFKSPLTAGNKTSANGQYKKNGFKHIAIKPDREHEKKKEQRKR